MATALVVEDHPDHAAMVASYLKLYHYEPVVVAGDGETALKMVRTFAPDVVLLDLMLPDINGFDVCRRLRTDRATMLTPVVMLTALEGHENLLRGFRVGANAYVTKPFAIADLLKAIATARAWRDEMVQRNLDGEIHVELNSEITLLNDLNDFLLNLCQSTPFESEQVMQLRQAVMEMAHNAIEWGNRHQSDRLVTIRYRVYPDRVEIVVRDQGTGFKLDDLPHAAVADDPFTHLDVRDKLGLRAGGFGLMICKGMVDELSYNDVGNEVTLIKRFRSESELVSDPKP
jgi:DNA-binding response OmpR family regulator